MGLVLDRPPIGAAAPLAKNPALNLALNATAMPEVLLQAADNVQAPLPLATTGAQRWVWHSRYGAMLIEVIAGEIFVNGGRVEPHAP